MVGQALLDTLAVELGDVFTPEVRRAWAMAYGILAGPMQGAMQEDRAAAAA
jgi:hemoglobin-like flavoprotein